MSCFFNLSVNANPRPEFWNNWNLPSDLFACCFSCLMLPFSLTLNLHVVRASVHAGDPAELRDTRHVSSLWGHWLWLWEVQDPGGKTFSFFIFYFLKKHNSWQNVRGLRYEIFHIGYLHLDLLSLLLFHFIFFKNDLASHCILFHSLHWEQSKISN